jgi:uncharacterized protein (TIGR02246 family)
MKVRIQLPGLLAAVLVAACSQQQTQGVSDVATLDPATVRAQVEQFVSAWNAEDLAAVEKMVAEDAVLMQPEGPPLAGRAAILETMAGGYDVEMYQQSATVDEVAALGEYAYGRGTWSLNPTAANEAGEGMNGKWSAVYRPSPDGGWQTWRWMWNQPAGQVVAVEP